MNDHECTIGHGVPEGFSRASDHPQSETVTVTFDRHDAVSILRALREVVDPEVLRVVAQAEIAR